MVLIFTLQCPKGLRATLNCLGVKALIVGTFSKVLRAQARMKGVVWTFMAGVLISTSPVVCILLILQLIISTEMVHMAPSK